MKGIRIIAGPQLFSSKMYIFEEKICPCNHYLKATKDFTINATKIRHSYSKIRQFKLKLFQNISKFQKFETCISFRSFSIFEYSTVLSDAESTENNSIYNEKKIVVSDHCLSL